jgi:hypothetical protein
MVLSWHLPQETEENHENHSQDSPSQDSNQTLFKFKPEVLPLEPISLVKNKLAFCIINSSVI